MKKRTVINIGGTARSGSTLLNLILANDDHALSVGEVHALFRPVRVHHHEEIRNLGVADEPWSKIIKQGEKDLYKSVFDNNQEIDFIIDSSKNYFWIQEQNRNCKRLGIDYKNVLIYKSPHEMANSFLKRGINWEKTYVDYHRRYLSVVENIFIVSYKDLVQDPKTLVALCKWLDIPYFEGKMDYWKRESKHFFGSSTPTNKRSIKYDRPDFPDLGSIVEKQIAEQPMIKDIWHYLELKKQSTIQGRSNVDISLLLNRGKLTFIKTKQVIQRAYRRLFPENYFKEFKNK